MKTASVAPGDDVSAALRLFHREKLVAIALGRPGGDRRQEHETPGVLRRAVPGHTVLREVGAT